MEDDTCPCCATPVDRFRQDRWIDGIDAPLPTDVAGALGRLTGDAPVRSLGAWARTVRAAVDGPMDPDDLCHVEGPSPHFGLIGRRRYDFACCVDAIILGAIEDASVAVGTRSPDGTAIDLAVDPDGAVEVWPLDTVVSFGVDPHIATGETSRLALGYRAICPYVRAFPSIGQYYRWAAMTPAPTVVFGPDTAVSLACALTKAAQGGSPHRTHGGTT